MKTLFVGVEAAIATTPRPCLSLCLDITHLQQSSGDGSLTSIKHRRENRPHLTQERLSGRRWVRWS